MMKYRFSPGAGFCPTMKKEGGDSVFGDFVSGTLFYAQKVSVEP